MPSADLNPYELIIARRLRHWIRSMYLRHSQLVQEYKAQYHLPLSEALVSRWLSGDSRISPVYYRNLQAILASHIKRARIVPEFGMKQELLDWDGLVFRDEHLERERIRHQSLIVGELHSSRPMSGHFYRKPIRDEIILRLLNPDQHGLFHPGVVALSGLPGSGRSEMLLEILERVALFFDGGILYADLGNSSRVIWQQWCQGLGVKRNQALQKIDALIHQKQGRWLVVIENLNDGQKLKKLLPSGRYWVLASVYGVAPLQPLGWEQYAYPIAPLNQRETLDWLKIRMGQKWGNPNDRQHGLQLHHLTEGLPMAVAILAALVHSRGWKEVFEAMGDPYRAVSFIRYASKMETPTSSLTRAIDLAFDTLTLAEQETLCALAHYAPGKPIPEMLFHNLTHGIFRNHTHQLVEKGMLQRFEHEHWQVTVLRLHRLIALYALAHVLPDRKSQALPANGHK